MAQRTSRARRGRPPSIETATLLDVAREVFLERGVHATTLEVAQRAGISEGTLFHRFKTKEGLFRAAMRFDLQDLPQWLKEQLANLEQLELRDALTRLATSMLELGRVALPLMMMEWSNRDWLCHAPSEKDRGVYHQLLEAFGRYFESQMQAGALRRVDTQILSRVFIGSLHHYNMTRIFARESDAFALPEAEFVRGLVDLLLGGALPGDGRSSEAQSNAPSLGDAQPRDAQPGDVQPGNAQPRDAQPRDAQPRDAQPRDAQPRDVQPGDAQPAEGRPAAEQRASQPRPAPPETPPASSRARTSRGALRRR